MFDDLCFIIVKIIGGRVAVNYTLKQNNVIILDRHGCKLQPAHVPKIVMQ